MIARVGQVESRTEARIYVWDAIVRATHWTIALSIVLLSLTGFYIGHPLFTVAGEAREHFVTGYVRVIHFYTAIAFSAAVFTRIYWMFLGSGKYSSWKQFVPTNMGRIRDLIHAMMFFALIRRQEPECPGHNPLAGATYGGIFLLYLTMIFTGLGLYGVFADANHWTHSFLPLANVLGGAQPTRYVHHIVMWIILAFVCFHVYIASLVSIVGKNGTVDSMFSGYKWFKNPEKLN